MLTPKIAMYAFQQKPIVIIGHSSRQRLRWKLTPFIVVSSCDIPAPDDNQNLHYPCRQPKEDCLESIIPVFLQNKMEEVTQSAIGYSQRQDGEEQYPSLGIDEWVQGFADLVPFAVTLWR